MRQRRLGQKSPFVSVLGIGTWQIESVDDDEQIAAVQSAFEAGITLFDTAPVYGAGHAEKVLTRALESHRHEVFIVTKCGLRSDPANRTQTRDSRRLSIRKDIEGSLRRLRTDYVDLLLIHWPDPQTPLPEAMAALDEVRRAGLTRYIGVSNFSAAQTRECALHAPIVANEVGYHMFDRRWEDELVSTAQELGIGVIAYGCLAQGLLTDR